MQAVLVAPHKGVKGHNTLVYTLPLCFRPHTTWYFTPFRAP